MEMLLPMHGDHGMVCRGVDKQNSQPGSVAPKFNKTIMLKHA